MAEEKLLFQLLSMTRHFSSFLMVKKCKSHTEIKTPVTLEIFLGQIDFVGQKAKNVGAKSKR